jgi:methylmalonyl-CoA mutase C-terminal domain/subunit
MMSERKKRILISKLGLDGHDRGAKVIVYALRDAGMEVIYTGLHQTPKDTAMIALQEDVDCIGLSILSGAHLFLCEQLMAELKEKGIDHIPVMLGGIIPQKDIDRLKEIGIKAIFPSGSSLEEIIKFVKELP